MPEQDQLAKAAAAEIGDGQVVGLGTGRAASRAIRAIAERVRAEGLSIRGVPTSEESAGLAASLGLEVIPLEEATAVDVVLDGVDELDPQMGMIKGQGGAMTREKIVAHAAERRVYLMQRTKLVERLGERCPVPVEVVASAALLVRTILAKQGIEGDWRLDDAGGLVMTDNGNPILDVPLGPDESAHLLAENLDATPGVVGHGLFLTEADKVLIEDERGALEVSER